MLVVVSFYKMFCSVRFLTPPTHSPLPTLSTLSSSSGAVIIIQTIGCCNCMYCSCGKWLGIRSSWVLFNVLSKWAGKSRSSDTHKKTGRNKREKAWADRRMSPGLQGFDFGQTNVCFSKCFIVGWIKADVDQSLPPPLPIRVLVKRCIEKRGRTC